MMATLQVGDAVESLPTFLRWQDVLGVCVIKILA